MVVALLKIEQVVSNVAVWILCDTERPAVLATGLFSCKPPTVPMPCSIVRATPLFLADGREER